jgi:hypothetical protein
MVDDYRDEERAVHHLYLHPGPGHWGSTANGPAAPSLPIRCSHRRRSGTPARG